MKPPVVLLESFTPARSSRSYRFTGFRHDVVAHAAGDVIPALQRIEAAVDAGFHAAGFVTYEAAAGLGSGLTTRASGDMPLLWFGIFSGRDDILPNESCGESFSAGNWHDSETDDRYVGNIRRIRDYIASGDTYQVNYTFRRRFRLSGSPFAFYRELCRRQRTSFCAYIEVGKWRIASASPELFFSLSGREIAMRPMKGTAQRGRWVEEDEMRRYELRENEKERAENLMIVDLLRNDLGIISEPGSVAVDSLFDVETLETVHQMTSSVSSRLREDVPLYCLFSSLFPCGSITGAPKRRTMEIIAELENGPRGLYTGCIGFISPGRESVFSVAIRTAVINAETAEGEIGIGSGITWSSDPTAEYRECLAKSMFASDPKPEFSLVETLRWEPERGYRLLRRHLRRMAHSARFFRFAWDVTVALGTLRDTTAALRETAKVRLLLGADGTMRTETALLEEDPPEEVFEVALASGAVDSSEPLLYHKTTHRPWYERTAPSGVADLIFVNERGEITEAANHNIVVEQDGLLVTPPKESGLLAGTFRDALLAAGVLQEKVLYADDLKRANSLYLINSVRGWRRAKLKNDAMM